MKTPTSTTLDDSKVTFPNLVSGSVLSDKELHIDKDIIKYALFKTFGDSSSSIKFTDAMRQSYPGEYVDSSLVDHVISASLQNRRGESCVSVQVKAYSIGSDPEVIFGDMSIVFFALNGDRVSLQTAAHLIDGHCYINDSEYEEMFEEVFNGVIPSSEVDDKTSTETDVLLSFDKKEVLKDSEDYSGHKVRQQALQDVKEGKIDPYELVLTYRLSMETDKVLQDREKIKEPSVASAQTSWIGRISSFFNRGEQK